MNNVKVINRLCTIIDEDIYYVSKDYKITTRKEDAKEFYTFDTKIIFYLAHESFFPEGKYHIDTELIVTKK